MKGLLAIPVLISVLLSCSSESRRNGDSYIIRYVNIARVFDYAVKHDPEAAKILNSGRKVLKSIEKPGIYRPGDEESDVSDGSESENIAATDDEKKIKSRLYGRIKTAVSNTARRHDADFIFNTGDAVIYSKSSYDITDDVIREYKKLNDISSPDIK